VNAGRPQVSGNIIKQEKKVRSKGQGRFEGSNTKTRRGIFRSAALGKARRSGKFVAGGAALQRPKRGNRGGESKRGPPSKRVREQGASFVLQTGDWTDTSAGGTELFYRRIIGNLVGSRGGRKFKKRNLLKKCNLSGEKRPGQFHGKKSQPTIRLVRNSRSN